MPQVKLTRDQLVVGNFYKTCSGCVYFVLHPEQEGVCRTMIRFKETSAGWSYECYATKSRAKSFEPYDGAGVVKRMDDSCLAGLNRWLRNTGHREFCSIFVKPAGVMDEFSKVEAFAEGSDMLMTVPPDLIKGAIRMMGDGVCGQNYLATPYTKLSSSDDFLRNAGLNNAALTASRWVALLSSLGVTAVSPIVLAHCGCVSAATLGEPHPDPLDAAFWYGWCAPILSASASVIIPPVHGWRDSVGVAAEAMTALESGRPVFVIEDERDLEADG